MRELRRPVDVPAELHGGIDVTGGLDTDADGFPDTTVTDDGADLVLCTDLDGDGFADQVLRIGPDGTAREVISEVPGAVGLLGGAEFGAEFGAGPG